MNASRRLASSGVVDEVVAVDAHAAARRPAGCRPATAASSSCRRRWGRSGRRSRPPPTVERQVVDRGERAGASRRCGRSARRQSAMGVLRLGVPEVTDYVATHASALKAHRQSLKNREHNRQFRSRLRSALKSIRAAIDGNDLAGAKNGAQADHLAHRQDGEQRHYSQERGRPLQVAADDAASPPRSRSSTASAYSHQPSVHAAAPASPRTIRRPAARAGRAGRRPTA